MAELVHGSEADVERLSAEVAALRQENAVLHKELDGATPKSGAHRARVAAGTVLGALLSLGAVLVSLSFIPLD